MEEDETIDGVAVLNETRDLFKRFAVFPSLAALNATTLWAAHTHVHQVFNTSPRLAIMALEKQCGKTRVLDLLALVCANVEANDVDPTGPTLMALIDQDHPTLLLDECDTFWGTYGGKGKGQVRAIANAGYKQGAVIRRRSGGAWVKYNIFGPMAFAGIGVLPETIMDRAVLVQMRKRKDGEVVEKYMPRMHAPLGKLTGDSLGAWATSVGLELATAWPELPDGIEDRAAEVWEPLIAIADQASGHWPESARAACVELALKVSDESVPTPAVRLLGDLRTVWTGQNLPTATIVRRLFEVPGAPWKGMWEPSRAPNEIATLLKTYGVVPTKVKDENNMPKQGYRLVDLRPVWSRVVPAKPELVPARNGSDLRGSGSSGKISQAVSALFSGGTCGPDCNHPEHRR